MPIIRLRNPFSVEQWLSWILSVAIAIFTVVTFLYGNFPMKSDVEERFDRIEDKLDAITLTISPGRRSR